MKEIRLGNKVRDKVTGFEGIATSQTENLNGSKSISVVNGHDKYGCAREMDVDVTQLEYTGLGVAKAIKR